MGLLKSRMQGYTFSEERARSYKSLTPPPGTRLFAEISLDLRVRGVGERLFTYSIPEHLSSEVFVGTQVLVPFGNQDLVAGLVMSIKGIDPEESLQGAGGLRLDKTREISEVLDSRPIFGSEYIEFLHWVADYYLCSIADVLSAAIPAEIGLKVKRMVRLLAPINQAISDLLSNQSHRNPEEQIKIVLGSSSGELSVKSLKDKCGLPAQSFYSALSRLKRRAEVEVIGRSAEAAAPKLVKHLVWTGKEALSKRHSEILSCLRRSNGSLPMSKLIEETGAASNTIKRMVNEGILSIHELDEFRDPLKSVSHSQLLKPELSLQQAEVFSVLRDQLHQVWQMHSSWKEPQEPWLLHGVTGSGKTEIYMRLIEEALSAGRAALMLVPEISLTPQLSERLIGRFGAQVAIWHSALSAGERYDTWRRVQSGELKLVLGARSAVLMHIPDLGLIILDEEHDGSYKQSTPSPRYSARLLARQRGWREGALVLLGSATPDAVSYHCASNSGHVLELPERIFKQALPDSMLVDMRTEFSAGNRSIISRALQQELDACLKNHEQAILLINRRGYASHVFCRACGHVQMCRHCSVSLVFHSLGPSKEDDLNFGRLSCHHCGFSQDSGPECPSCGGPFLKQFGIGTQRVQEEVQSLFPEARTLRLDSDTGARKGATAEILSDFSGGRADILIGTQIIAKGLDIPSVTLVGVLAADAAFNLPDFRSLERGFQLLTQVSGRAGRGKLPGRVILQTYNVELPALLLAKRHDYAGFIAKELEARRQFEYPPFSSLVRVLASGPDDGQVHSALERLAEELSNYLEELELIRVLGPAPCLIERIKGLYRHHLIIKNLMGEEGHKAISSFFRGRSYPQGVRLSIDVDPLDLI